MAAYDLDLRATGEVLRRESVVRVAFRDGDALYLIPLGYVWLRDAMHGSG